MDDNFEAGSRANDADVKPSVTREDLNKTWIGLGAALEWIALRGQPIPRESYRDREDEADEAFVARLVDLPSKVADSIVRGVPEEDTRKQVSIPSGIWRQTATSDVNDADRPYRLIGTDDDDQWEGAILGVQVAGYRRVQVRSAFILENWPEHTLEIETDRKRAVSRAEVRRLIDIIVARTPASLAPISKDDIADLVRSIIPEAPRDMVRDLLGDFFPNPKRGPKGKRDPQRKSRLQKYREELIAAELRN
nr:hypothetical protein [Marinicella sp. W31]MDC2878619.1 hypothetical protein [Marinicella sp. W31]